MLVGRTSTEILLGLLVASNRSPTLGLSGKGDLLLYRMEKCRSDLGAQTLGTSFSPSLCFARWPPVVTRLASSSLLFSSIETAPLSQKFLEVSEPNPVGQLGSHDPPPELGLATLEPCG